MYRTQLLVILLYTVTLSHENVPQLDSKRRPQNDNANRKRRQAISLGVAQSGALRLYPQEKDSKNGNSTLAPTSLDSILQNYAQVIKEQAQNDIKARHKSGGLNITESIYNASIAFAIDNNRTSALHNNTIHLLQNVSSVAQQPVQHDPIVSLLDVSNTTMQNETITIPRTNFTAPRSEENTYLEVNGINKTNLFPNKTVILSNVNSENRGNINLNMTNATTNAPEIVSAISDLRSQTELINATNSLEAVSESRETHENTINQYNITNTTNLHKIITTENLNNLTSNLSNTTNQQHIKEDTFRQPTVENKIRMRYHVLPHYTFIYYVNKAPGNSSSMYSENF